MCGRFNLQTNAAAWTEDFLPLWTDDEVAAKASEYAIAARYNIAPTQAVSCIHSGDGDRREWSLFRWGLVPSWADDLAIGNRMINARSETVHEKRSFQNAFRHRRCLIPADGYYEWMKTPSGKQPYQIRHAGDKVLAMAGLWESNSRACDGDQTVNTFTVLTTSANQTTYEIHDRMPVFLDADQQSVWLDSAVDDPKQLRPLLRPAPEDWLLVFPVSTIVNSPRNDEPECVQKIELATETDQRDERRSDLPQQQDLF